MENETKPGKSETIGMDEAGRRYTWIPAMDERPRHARPVSYDFGHTVTERSIGDYLRSYPGVCVGDRIREQQTRIGNKVIRCRWVNGLPIPWIEAKPILPNRCPAPIPISRKKG